MAGSYLLFNIETTGLREVTGRLAGYDKESASYLREMVRNLARKYVEYLKSEAPSDTGKLKQGITFKTYQSGTVTEARITSKETYTGYVLHGTRPHAPPISALQGWADRHGINVWRVWWSIKRNGTSTWSLAKYGEKANRFVKRAEERMKPEYQKEVTNLAGHVRKWLVGW